MYRTQPETDIRDMYNPYKAEDHEYVMKMKPLVQYALAEGKITGTKHATLEAILIAYLMGKGYDLQGVATIADAGLALFVIYLFNFVWNEAVIDFADAFIAAIAIGIDEWFFHKYVANGVLPQRKEE